MKIEAGQVWVLEGVGELGEASNEMLVAGVARAGGVVRRVHLLHSMGSYIRERRPLWDDSGERVVGWTRFYWTGCQPYFSPDWNDSEHPPGASLRQ
jgi:hypothetical protein